MQTLRSIDRSPGGVDSKRPELDGPGQRHGETAGRQRLPEIERTRPRRALIDDEKHGIIDPMIRVHVREGRMDVDRIPAGGEKVGLQRDHTLEAAYLCWQSDLVEKSGGIEPERQTKLIAKRE